MISFPLTALKSPAAFHEQIKSLERARVRNFHLKCSASFVLKYLWTSNNLIPTYVNRETRVYFQDTWYMEQCSLGSFYLEGL